MSRHQNNCSSRVWTGIQICLPNINRFFFFPCTSAVLNKPNGLFFRDIVFVWFLWQRMQNTMNYWAKNTDCACKSYTFLLQINFAILLKKWHESVFCQRFCRNKWFCSMLTFANPSEHSSLFLFTSFCTFSYDKSNTFLLIVVIFFPFF